ncbi:MAG: sodium/solute symporter [Rhodothermales bacterium]
MKPLRQIDPAVGKSLFLKRLALGGLLLVLLGMMPLQAQAQSKRDSLQWETLPALPDSIGFAGVFAGVSNDALIVAGGANFPSGSNFDGHPKVWHDNVFVLPDPDGQWETGFQLPQSTAYGVSVTWEDVLICIGGGDQENHFTEVYAARWDGETVTYTALAPLPRPMAFGAGVVVGNTIYIAGGIESPDAIKALHNFWALDLTLPSTDQVWQNLPAWPGPERMLPVMAALDKDVYLFSGASLFADSLGKPARRLLQDGYKFDTVTQQWTQLKEIPRPLIAAPGPGIPVGTSHLLFLAGDDGEHAGDAATLRDNHPGFSTDIFAYNTLADTWNVQGHFPGHRPEDLGVHRNEGSYPPVTTPIVSWNGHSVIPTGEIRPGVRTPKVWSGTWTATARSFGMANSIVLGSYLLLIVIMGLYFSRRASTTQDFFLAGGRIPWWAAGLSIFATMLSAITYLSIPATVYATDWTRFLLNMGIPLIAPLVILFFLPFYRRLNVTSAYEYLEQRFNVSLRMLGSVSFILFQLGRMGIVLLLPALALSAVTGLNLFWCIGLMGLLSTLYTVLGGMEAVIWTDVIQVFVLVGGAIAALFIIVNDLPGGLGQILSEAAAYDKLDFVNPGWDLTRDSLLVIVIGMVFANLLPYTTDQAVVQRYMTTSSEKAARNAIWTGALVAVPASILFFFLGTALFVFYLNFPAQLTPLSKADQLLPWFIIQEMPAGFGGLVIAGVFAAAMSSLDSSIHAITTSITTDFIRRFRPERSDRAWLNLARRLTIVLGLLGTASAMLIGTWDLGLLWSIFLDITGLFLGTLGGLFSLGIFTKRTTAIHAWAGAIVSVVALAYVSFATAWSGLLFGAIGTLMCFIVGWIASYVIPGDQNKRDLKGLTIHS